MGLQIREIWRDIERPPRSFIVFALTDAFDQPVGLPRNKLAATSR
jgi:hypothetical protein